MINIKLSVLVDNNTFIDRYFLGEPGFSIFIEVDGKRILFDLGYSNIFIKNAEKMAINLRSIDYIVISHGHSDHTWGLDPLIRLYTESKAEKIDFKKPTLIAHPDAFKSRVLNDQEIGCIISENKIRTSFNLDYHQEPIWLTDNLVYLGEIERKFDFENQSPIGKILKGNLAEDDFLHDDSALVYKNSKGLVIIVGCSHSGICNIIEYAKKVCNETRVVDIIGGFHLLNPPKEQLKGVVDYIKKLRPSRMHACHCTDFNAKLALSKVAHLDEVGVGLKLEYD